MDFNERLKNYEGYHTIGQAATKLKEQGIEIPIPTIRNWVNEMHQLQFHTLKRSNVRGERIFFDLDIEIIRFIYEAKKKFGNSLTMIAICTMIQEQERFKAHLEYNPTDSDLTSGETGAPVLTEHRLREYLKAELDELNRLKEEMIQAKLHYEEQLRLLPDATEEKEKRIKEIEETVFAEELLNKQKEERLIETRTAIVNAQIKERTIRAKLRVRAEEEWSKNPVMKGFLLKKEDTAAKLLFIDKFIDKNYEKEITKDS